MSDHHESPQEVKEILEVVSVEIPKLLESISNVVYKAENAESMGKSIASFYKQMKEAGMTDEQAFEMTQKFMGSFSLGGMISQALGGVGKNGGRDWEEFGKRMKDKAHKESDEDDE